MSDNILENLLNIKEQVVKKSNNEDKKLALLEDVFSISKLESAKTNKNLKENEVNLVDSLLGLAESFKSLPEKTVKEIVVSNNDANIFEDLTSFLTKTRNDLTLKENSLMADATKAISNSLTPKHLKPVSDYEIDKFNVMEKVTKTAKSIKEQIDTEDFTLDQLQKEFSRFKQLTTLQLQSLGGGGSTKISNMDDVDITGQADGYALKYNASTGKYDFGEVASDLSAVAQDILPDADGTRDIGSTTKAFNNGYFKNVYVEGSILEVDTDTTLKGDITLGVNTGDSTEDTITVNARFVSNLEPLTTVTYDLGSPERRWRDIYLSGNTIDLAGATISGDGTGAIQISATGATLPAGSKVGADTIAKADSVTGIPTKSVPLFTQAGGLSTAAVTFTMAAGSSNASVFTNFTKSNGNAQGKFELFSF